MNTDINTAAILAPTGVLYVSYFYRTGYLFHSALHQCQNTRSKLQVLRDMGIHECFSTFKHPGLSVPTKQIKGFHATPTPYKTMQYHTKQIPAGNASWVCLVVHLIIPQQPKRQCLGELRRLLLPKTHLKNWKHATFDKDQGRRGVLRKPLIEWRDSQLQCVDQGVTGVSPGESLLCIGRECQSAKDTDPGDTTDTGWPHKETHLPTWKWFSLLCVWVPFEKPKHKSLSWFSETLVKSYKLDFLRCWDFLQALLVSWVLS